MITWMQYVTYFLAGGLYYLMIAAFFTVAAAYPMSAVWLLLLAVVFGGYLSGLSFVAPQLAAIAGGCSAVVFLIYVVLLIASDPADIVGLILTVPGLLALAVSAATLRNRRPSLWLRHSSAWARFGMGMAIVIPALIATWLTARITSRLLL